jgi:hypothetical protein
MNGYVIQTERSAQQVEQESNPRLARYVGRSETTHLVGYAKVWRTRRGAEDWMTERGYSGSVVAVTLTSSRRSAKAVIV